MPLARIAAEVGTPVYVYSRATFERHAQAFRDGLKDCPRVHLAYAIKANPNLAVLRLMANAGYGADVVSGGELERALAAGMPAEDVVFSGVGKTRDELAQGLDRGIGQFNLELEAEGVALSEIAAARGQRAPCVLRVNPDVDAGTHAKISTGKAENKFGVAIADAPAIYARLAALPGPRTCAASRRISAASCSASRRWRRPITASASWSPSCAPPGTASTASISAAAWASPTRPRTSRSGPTEYGAMVARVTRDWDVELMFEPGRVIAGNAGVLLTKVIWVKPSPANPWVIVDAAMNDLARPALYDAWHDFVAVKPTGERFVANIAGPVCESGDTFAKARDIDLVKEGDLAIFRTAGAYGATMASTYNSRALVPEVMVDGDRYAVVAERISPKTIMDEERVPEWL